LELRGQPVPVLENVLSHHANTKGEYSISQEGTLAYSPGAFSSFTIALVDRDNRRTPLLARPTRSNHFKISPDGKRLAIEIFDGRQYDIWVYEWELDTMTRVTHDESDDQYPVWSPDGDTIIFRSERESVGNIYWKRADGTGQAHRLTESNNIQNPYSWHPSGQYVAVVEITQSNLRDVRILPLEGDDQKGWTGGDLTTLMGESYGEFQPVFSPDGNWLAYTSAESGRAEVYVRPFQGQGRRKRVSNNGGWASAWAHDGASLYYEQLGQIFSVSYQIEGSELLVGKPEPWSQPFNVQAGSFLRSDVFPDGRIAIRLPFGEESERNRDSIILVENFLDYLREKVPNNDE
jgi:Tol biopolymer transport system component